MSSRPTIFSTIPLSVRFGWGICGRYLLRELSRFGDVRLVYDNYTSERSSNVIEDEWIRSRIATPSEQALFASPHQHLAVHGLTEYGDFSASPGGGAANVAVSFNLMLTNESVEQLRDSVRYIVAGSDWCRDLFLSHGIPAVAAPQGVDHALFHEGLADKTMNDDRFIIYSGGKFEFRKGQDYVLRAVRHMQQKYPDVVLVAQWSNPWPYSYNTMSYSSLIDFEPLHTIEAWEIPEVLKRVMIQNRFDTRRVIIAPSTEHALAPILIRETDIGIFPNRIEGGTNLMLMEYMACGKPAIATYHTGHRDVLSEDWALLMKNNRMEHLKEHYPPGFNSWYESDIDELISLLEWSYMNRDKAKALGRKAARRMKDFSWSEMAARIVEGP